MLCLIILDDVFFNSFLSDYILVGNYSLMIEDILIEERLGVLIDSGEDFFFFLEIVFIICIFSRGLFFEEKFFYVVF